jgi:LysR family hydrogen peroxide-inducible transcriptional activator
MNLRDLRYLVAVADHRHFGRAAAASFVSQPTLSMQIKKLEQELGVELVERGGRQIVLTDAGERVVERARAILDEAEAIGGIAQQARDPEAGSIRLGIFPTLGPYLLPHVIPAVHARFPRLELLLVEEKTDDVLRQLHAGALEVGVLALPAGDNRLHQETLFREDFVLAVPAGHHLDEPVSAAEVGVDVGALAGEDMLLLEEGHCLRDQALSVCELNGARERRGFRATSLETLRQMVAAGVGITLLPELAVRPPVVPSPDVRLLRFSEPVPHRTIGMLWRRSSVRSGLLQELAEIVRSRAAAVLSDGGPSPASPP